MAATFISLDAYSDALVVLGTAGIVVPLVRHFGLSPVLAYLVAGAVLGPLGLGSFMDKAPWLYWVTVVDAKNVAGIAELGVVFLLFLIGLELSYQRLLTMRRLVFGLGTLQVVLCTSVIAGIAMFAGSKPAAAVIIGACLALSSTAIVIELLSKQRRLLHDGRSHQLLRSCWRRTSPSCRSCCSSPSWATARAARSSPGSCSRWPRRRWPSA